MKSSDEDHVICPLDPTLSLFKSYISGGIDDP